MTSTVAMLPWALLLSALAGFWAWRAWQAGRRRAAVGRLGWALLPWALLMVGALRLAVRVADAVVDWATALVFSPTVWLGAALGVVSVALIAYGSRGREPGAVASDRSDPSTGRTKPATRARGRSSGDDDLDEIEEILRRHGIQ
ncbi:hypothetical protein [Mumia flava]|nr:hypothetical protein [Mumia flava]